MVSLHSLSAANPTQDFDQPAFSIPSDLIVSAPGQVPAGLPVIPESPADFSGFDEDPCENPGQSGLTYQDYVQIPCIVTPRPAPSLPIACGFTLKTPVWLAKRSLQI